jgi:hypothetical protein
MNDVGMHATFSSFLICHPHGCHEDAVAHERKRVVLMMQARRAGQLGLLGPHGPLVPLADVQRMPVDGNLPVTMVIDAMEANEGSQCVYKDS